jgi:hypothetical protein
MAKEMEGWTVCPKCGAKNPPVADQCTCGYKYKDWERASWAGEQGGTSEPPPEAKPTGTVGEGVPPASGYLLLGIAVWLFRVLAVVYFGIGLYAWFKVRAVLQPYQQIEALLALAVYTFLLWVAGDVIRILLDMRARIERSPGPSR